MDRPTAINRVIEIKNIIQGMKQFSGRSELIARQISTVGMLKRIKLSERNIKLLVDEREKDLKKAHILFCDKYKPC